MSTAPRDRAVFWRDERRLALAAQIIFVVVIAVALWAGVEALQASFRRQNIRLDWSFWRQPAGFELTALSWTVDLETLTFKQYDPGDSAGEALIAGLFNTIYVAALGIILATVFGIVVGVARL